MFRDTMPKKTLFDQYLDEEKRLDIVKLQKAELAALHHCQKN